MLFQYGPALGTVLLLGAIAVAQYGFLPIRPARLVAKLESLGQHVTARRQHGRFPRNADSLGARDLGEEMRPELVETVLKVGAPHRNTGLETWNGSLFFFLPCFLKLCKG